MVINAQTDTQSTFIEYVMWSAQLKIRHLYHIPFLQDTRPITEEGAGRLSHPGGVDDSSEKVCARLDSTAAHRNSGRHTQDLHKIKPAGSPAWMGEGFRKSHPLCSCW